MKKLICLLLSAVLLVALAACSKSSPVSDTPDGKAGLANPMKTVASLEELNEAVGGSLCSPAVMGVTNEGFHLIEGGFVVAEYEFTVNSTEFVFRCSEELTQDISGLYFGDGAAFGSAATETVATASDETWKAARWITDARQYVLAVRDNGSMDAETFAGIAEEFRAATAEEPVTAKIVNPVTEFDSLEALNTEIGGKLCRPDVSGVTNERYTVIDAGIRVADYSFTVNSTLFSFRCSADTDVDISGLYFADKAAFTGKATGEMKIASDATWKTARWLSGDLQYVLSVKDSGTMDSETFAGIAEEFYAGTQDAPAGIAGVANPMTACGSLSEINEAVGGKLCRLPVMGVGEEAFFLIAGKSKIAEYRFTLNGLSYCFRCSADTASDISGLYLADGAAFPDAITEEPAVASDSEYKAARWLSGDRQYVLSVKDDGTLTDDVFAGIVSEARTVMSAER